MNARTRCWGLLLGLVTLCASESWARPYRAMITRTAETSRGSTLETGLRYQGFLWGFGRPAGAILSVPYHQVAGHVRWGIVDHLELETQLELLIQKEPLNPNIGVFLGDIPIGLQWTFYEGHKIALGAWVRATIPTGPSGIDIIPPTLSDGTFDVEGTFILEARFTRKVRLMTNVGFLHHGVRNRGGRGDFDVPEAIRYDAALVGNLGERFLISLELSGRSFFRPAITPVWNDNQHLVEVTPGFRWEIVPKLVLEVAVGIGLTRDTREIYLLHPLAGLTYEFDFGS
jgi:hypothetical protein